MIIKIVKIYLGLSLVLLVDTFFMLTCSVMLWGGRDAANNTGMCSQGLGHTGFAPAHGVCAFPVYTA